MSGYSRNAWKQQWREKRVEGAAQHTSKRHAQVIARQMFRARPIVSKRPVTQK